MAKASPLPYKPKTKAKYLDQHRFPKVATSGYERDFIINYQGRSQEMVMDLAKKMTEIVK